MARLAASMAYTATLFTLVVVFLIARAQARLSATSRELLARDQRILDDIEKFDVLDRIVDRHEHRRILRSSETDFSFTALGATHNFELTVRRGLFDQNFTFVGLDGAGKPSQLSKEKDCIFKGPKKETFSFCGGVVYGRFLHEDEYVHVKPLPSGRHVVFRQRHLKQVEPGSCGITDDNLARFSNIDGIDLDILKGRELHISDDSPRHLHSHEGRHLHHEVHEKAATLQDAHDKYEATFSSTSSPHLDRLERRRLAETRTVDIVVVNDNLRYEEYGSGVLANTAYIVSLVADLYDEMDNDYLVNINLVSVVVFTESDPWTISLTNDDQSVDATTLLNLFSDYVYSVDTTLTSYLGNSFDHAMHLSGYDFYDDDSSSSAVVGLAWVGQLCVDDNNAVSPSSRNTAITQANYDDEKYVANIFTHELGHNLGMQHTNVQSTTYAADSPCNTDADEVMDPSASYDPVWASCSPEYWTSKVNGVGSYSAATCTTSDTTVHSSCGNGIVEGDEECDCLYGDCSGVDACCDGSTCTFSGSSVCSEQDPCCENVGGTCIIQTDTSTVCRESQDSTCDPSPEQCDGVNAKCPVDVVTASGTSCTSSVSGTGECFLGECVSIDAQCVEIGYELGQCDFPISGSTLYQACDSYIRCKSGTNTCQVSMPFFLKNGSPCTSGGSSGQCYGRVCITDSSQLPTPADIEQCSDGTKNGDETDTDCGGGLCTPCTEGKSCSDDDDCLYPSSCNTTTSLCDVTDYYPNDEGGDEETNWQNQLSSYWDKFKDWVQNNTAAAVGVFIAIGIIVLCCVVDCCCCGGRDRGARYVREVRMRPATAPVAEPVVAVPDNSNAYYK